MKAKKQSICIFLALFSFLFLAACDSPSKDQSSAENAQIHVLFTEDFSGMDSQSTLVSYDDTGAVVQKMNLSGALYYNLIPEGGGLLVDNGLKEVTIQHQVKTEKKHSALRGYFEVGQYFFYKDEVVKFYNYGYDDNKQYLTKIHYKEQEVDVKGFVYAFYPEKDVVWLVVGDDVTSGKIRLV